MRMCLVLEGGMSHGPLIIEEDRIRTIETAGVQEMLVKVLKQDKWVYKTVKGDKAQRGGLTESKILGELQEKLMATEPSPALKDLEAGDFARTPPQKKQVLRRV